MNADCSPGTASGRGHRPQKHVAASKTPGANVGARSSRVVNLRLMPTFQSTFEDHSWPTPSEKRDALAVGAGAEHQAPAQGPAKRKLERDTQPRDGSGRRDE